MSAKIRIGQYEDLRELARKSHDLKRAGFRCIDLVLSRPWSGAKQMVVLKRPFLLGRVDLQGRGVKEGETLVWVENHALLHALEKLGFVVGEFGVSEGVP
jgi:hypothetical protein